MKLIYGDAWKLFDKYKSTVLCIITNAVVKANGACVMGAGIAKQCKERYEQSQFNLGAGIKKYGNIVQPIEDRIIAFPVKFYWFDMADLTIIEDSCKQLRTLALYEKDKHFILPRPGCGNGKLDWKDVEPLLKRLLPDNVYVIDFEEDKDD